MRCVSEPLADKTRTFATTTGALIELQERLSSHGVTPVAMEATGMYWKPVWHMLEGYFELVLTNAQHIRNVPGRKTDVSDAGWIADLLAHGLIRSSFVPPERIQELRNLTCTRKQLVREISQPSSRIQKVLEDANLKVGSVLSDVLGKSGRAMLNALIAGQMRTKLVASHAAAANAFGSSVAFDGDTALICAPYDDESITGTSGSGSAYVFVLDVASLLEQLRERATGVGPGKSLANKAALAQAHYAVPNVQSTCVTLKTFTQEVTAQAGKNKLTDAQATELLTGAVNIMAAIGCDGS